jgi:multidrug resistance efflux pump
MNFFKLTAGIVIGFLSVFFLWAYFFKLAQGFVMQGELKSKSASFIIQTNVDGSIKEILVKVGGSVEVNQPVALIDSEEIETEIQVLNQSLKTNIQNIEELNTAKKSLEKQYNSISKRVASYKALIKDGYLAEDQLLNLENKKFDVEYRIKVLESDIEVKKGENIKTKEKIQFNENELKKYVIKANFSGNVKKINVSNKGNFVRTGDKIIELVPTEDIVKNITARLNPMFSDRVFIGDEVKVSFSSQKTDRNIETEYSGIVDYVSKDVIEDEKTKETYYEVIVNFKEDTNIQDIKLIPLGSVCEIYVSDESETFFGYLFNPIKNKLKHSFYETN